MNEVFYFSADEKTKEIELSSLEQSLMVRDSKGKAPANRPIQSWELISLIEGMCQKAGLDAEVKHIYVQDSGSTPVINQSEKEMYAAGDNIPVSKWLFNKVAFMIAIHHPEDTETTTAIVASYHQQGLQIAWGQHVSICSNMCIFGSNTMYTFGENKMPFDKMQIVLNEWILTFEEKRRADLDIIMGMKKIVMFHETMDQMLDNLIGKLYRAAVRKNYFKGRDSVLDMTKCGVLSKTIEEKFMAFENPSSEDYDETPTITLWTVYNWGTEILKAENTDIAIIFQIIAEWGGFVGKFSTFCLTQGWCLLVDDELPEFTNDDPYSQQDETVEVPVCLPTIEEEELPIAETRTENQAPVDAEEAIIPEPVKTIRPKKTKENPPADGDDF